MRIFDDFLRYNDRVQGLVNTARTNPSIQGVVLEVSPVYLSLWRLQEFFGYDWLRKKLRRYDLEAFIYIHKNLYQIGNSWISNRPIGLHDLNDFYNTLLKDTKEFFSDIELSKPFIVRVCFRPDPEGKPLPFEPNNEDNFHLVNETRPLSHLYGASRKLHDPVIGGTSIGVGDNDFGTLGGVLMDEISHKYYGVTCAHVVKEDTTVFHPAKYDKKSNMQLGSVIYRSPFTRLPEQFYDTADLSTTNKMDVALIELNSLPGKEVLKIGHVSSIIDDYHLSPPRDVTFTGRTSGHRDAVYFNGQAEYYDFHAGEERYRIEKLQQILVDPDGSNSRGRPTQEGDSGAWVCSSGEKAPAWCGMVIGGYKQTSYALSAEKIMNWLRDKTGLTLTFLQ